MTQHYIAFKTDMVKSKKIPDRGDVQEKFLKVAEDLNSRFSESFESRFVVTHGDEAQGLIKPTAADSVIEIIEALVEGIAPVQLRFGLGFGTLSTRLQEVSIGMDGEAWQKAKSAIEEARHSHQETCFRGFNFRVERLLEALTNLLLFHHSHWTKEQLEVIGWIRRGLSQSSVADLLGVSEAAVSKRLSAAGWRQYLDGKGSLKALLLQATLT